MVTRAERFKEMRTETKKKVEDAALTTFLEKGISGTKMQDIAKTANVSVGVLYRYYASKEALIEKILSYASEGIRYANNILERQKDDPKTIFISVASHMLYELNSEHSTAQLITLINQILGTQDGYELAQSAGLITEDITFKNNLMKLFSKGMESGAFKKGDTEELSCFFISSWQGIAMSKLILKEQFKMPSLVTFTSFILENED